MFVAVPGLGALLQVDLRAANIREERDRRLVVDLGVVQCGAGVRVQPVVDRGFSAAIVEVSVAVRHL